MGKILFPPSSLLFLWNEERAPAMGGTRNAPDPSVCPAPPPLEHEGPSSASGHGLKLRPTLERARRGSPRPSKKSCSQPVSLRSREVPRTAIGDCRRRRLPELRIEDPPGL